MKQVINNIITNSTESMPHGGLINIDVQNFETKDCTSNVESSLPGKKYIKIMINDQGKGIEKTHLDTVFDPYFTTKEMGTIKGSGLGLTTVYSIVSRHEGRIMVDSEMGRSSLV